ncbi:MAG: DUF883 family protein [Pigmentiphaga sp.]|uniref:DUF883 family protein n=1 Tax=Pigmentiphaga sp. TaxID=1977564 RepID=UPI0029B8575E|nr:DUF883 family protein [Pigmentiphaga sp.]MDX3907264.1 DUF883 family protein [Pigmentiphaga sp.]
MRTYSSGWSESRDKAADQVRGLIEDAEALLRSTAGYSSEELQAVRSRLRETLERAGGRYRDAQQSAVASYREATAKTDAYVHDNPWRAVGIAAAVGVVIGLLAIRR